MRHKTCAHGVELLCVEIPPPFVAGIMSPALDIFSFGVLMWEMFAADHVYRVSNWRLQLASEFDYFLNLASVCDVKGAE